MTTRYHNLSQNPFTHFSAEEELDFLDEIYYYPRYYNELLELLTTGVSRFILGKRGQGKSATIHKLFNDLSKNHTLPLLITRYDGIPLINNENHILYRIMQVMTLGIAEKLFLDPKLNKKLSKEQRRRLAFFIEMFYDEQCSSKFIEQARHIKQKNFSKKLKILFNKKIVHLLNGIINGTVHFSAVVLRQKAGLDNLDVAPIRHEYFGQMTIDPIRSYSIDEIANWDRSKLIGMLNFLIETSNTLGYNSIVILFDKIDEFPKINGDVEKITDFAVEVLSDTDLLYSRRLSVVFSLWSEIKKSLNKRGIRFDKFKDIDIRWDISEIEPLLDKRLKHFSINKENPVTFNKLMPIKNDRETAIELSDNSPRSLIRLLGDIYNEDFKNTEGNSFSNEAVSKGFVNFCRKFDYESQTPSKIGKSNDLVSWINRLLRVRKNEFSHKEWKDVFSLTPNVSTLQVENLIRLGLVRESYYQTNTGDAQFEIIDPKIKFLIKRGIIELDQ